MAIRRATEEIDRAAAEWAVKADVLGAEEKAGLEAWLALDIRHVGAYAKATAVLARLERTRALGPELKALRPHESWPSRRGLLRTGGIAASIAVIAGTGGYAWRLFGENTYFTEVGETEVLPLADGSVVTLNTDSRISVHYTAARREIALLRGEALFDVAKDKSRPFVVRAGDMQVRAVGTSFTVKRLPEEPVQVLVREGVVEMKRPEVPVAAPLRVSANTRAVAPVDAPIATTTVAEAEISRDLAWRTGRIAFDDETLAEAAREFARYSSTRIMIADPAIASRTVTGLFVSNDPVSFAKAVALSLDLRVEVGDGEVRLES